jgi:uncharacterized protein YlxW (UPF0749 family)
VSFISPAAHQKFILQCQRLINTISQEEQVDQKTEHLKKDLAELQQLVETYLNALSQLPELANQYNILQRRIRVNARRMQPVKSTKSRK